MRVLFFLACIFGSLYVDLHAGIPVSFGVDESQQIEQKKKCRHFSFFQQTQG